MQVSRNFHFASAALIISLLLVCPARATTFADIGAGLTGVQNASVAWGDYDNDGDLDILLTGQDIANTEIATVYRNDAGTFVDIGAGLTGVYLSSVAWGDYDNDGDLDILLTGQSSAGRVSKIYRNDSGTFTDINASITDVDNSSVAWGDYDNDGDLDILLTGQSSVGQVSKIYRNDSGTFTDISASITDVDNSSVAWGDYDNDGDLDILLTGRDVGAVQTATIYRNDSGTFTDIGAGLSGVEFSSVAWGDYDTDGDLDILLTGRGSALSKVATVYRNDAGLFTDIGAGLSGVELSSVAWGDHDNDGDLDILLSGLDSSSRISRIYRNDAGVFNDIGAAISGAYLSSVAWGDYDNDGDLDVLLAGRDNGNNRIARIFQSAATTPNTLPNAPSNLSAIWGESTLTFSWDAATDGETPSAGLSYNLYVGSGPLSNSVRSSQSDNTNGFRRVVQLGAAQQNTSITLQRGSLAEYHWSVQAVDAAFAGSPFAVGEILTPDPSITAITDVEGDQGGFVRVGIAAAGTDIASEATFPIQNYYVWRRVDPVTSSPEGWTPVGLSERSAAVNGANPVLATMIEETGFDIVDLNGRYFLNGTPPIDEVGIAPSFPPGTWEAVGSVPALQQATYQTVALTLADSTESEGIFWTSFVVSAHSTTPSVWYLSEPDSGYSVDNIAPGVPQQVNAIHGQSGLTVSWDPAPEPDFQYFRVYRSTNPGFVPGPGTLVHETAGTSWLDSPANPGAVFYKITALDYAGNESDAASSGAVTGIGDNPGVPAVFALRSASPNPFRAGTRIGFDLPAETSVSIQIFNVSGRVVRTLLRETMPPGVHSIHWDGTDANGQQVAAGVYLYYLRAGAFESTRRTVVIR